MKTTNFSDRKFQYKGTHLRLVVELVVEEGGTPCTQGRAHPVHPVQVPPGWGGVHHSEEGCRVEGEAPPVGYKGWSQGPGWVEGGPVDGQGLGVVEGVEDAIQSADTKKGKHVLSNPEV